MAKTILVVDDSNAVRQSVAFTLEQAGYTVIQAVDGLDGVSKSEVHKPDLIITDVNMPNLDGIGLVRKVRENPANKFLPIIVLTTEAQKTKMDEGKEAGATGWIVKPFDSDKLLGVVKKVIP
ncbi:MAG: response regulator [Spirochaetales bacterium]|nr:response regulator [Spirochaetales bacterium]